MASHISIGNITNSTFAIGDGAFVIVNDDVVISGTDEDEDNEDG